MLNFHPIALNDDPEAHILACTRCATPSQPASTEAVLARIRAAAAFDAAHPSTPAPGVLFTQGEPFAHPGLVSIIDCARKENFTRIGMRTDGGALSDRANAAGCISAGVRFFEIVFLSGNPARHDELSGARGLFDAMHAGITHLREFSQAEHTDLAVTAYIPLCTHNAADFAATAQAALDAGIDAIRVEAQPGAKVDSEVVSDVMRRAVTAGAYLWGLECLTLPHLYHELSITYEERP